PRGPVRQPRQPTLVGIPGQPLVHRLPRHPTPARHLRDRRALLQDLQHRPVPLLHHTQLHQHTRYPPTAISYLIAAKRQEHGKTANQFGVSPSYRNYCQPATGTPSATCRPGTGTVVSIINRNRTSLPVGETAPQTAPQ